MKSLQEQNATKIHALVIATLLLVALAANNVLSSTAFVFSSQQFVQPTQSVEPVIHEVTTAEGITGTHASAFELEHSNYQASKSMSSLFDEVIGRE